MSTADLIASAEAALRRPSTRSDFADALARGLELTRRHEAAGPRMLRETLAELAAFRHVQRDNAGNVFWSLYVRSLIDQAAWQPDAPGVAEAIGLLEAGDEAGVAALEAALAESHDREAD